LRYYAEHLARRAAESEPVSEPPVAIEESPAADTTIEKNPRQKLADWEFEFLHAQGMRPDHYVLDIGYGDSDVILELDIPESVVAEYEWAVELPYRQFLVPATLLNQYGPARVCDEHKP